MNLKTYQAPSMAEALNRVKRDLGADAVILHTRTYRQGGVLGFGARTVVEVTAADDVRVNPRKRRAPANTESQPEPRSESPAGSAPTHAAPSHHGLTSAAANLLHKAYQQGAFAENRHATRNAVATAQAGVAARQKPTAEPPPELTPAAPQPAAPSTSGGGDPQLAAELKQIRRLVQRLASQNGNAARHGPGSGDLPDVLFQKYLALLEQEVAEELAEEILSGMKKKLGSGELDESQIHRALNDEIAALLPQKADAFDFTRQRTEDGRPFTLALIGPTGVGKTTTVAKLAATFKLRDRLNVALLTIDTYRIAAVDQLRTYAEIIGVPLHVASSPMETQRALERCRDYDVVIIDTAGRSQRDDDKLDQLKSFIDAADPHEVHLVLSVTSRQEVMLEIAERFSRIRTDKLIFTKLDEAVNFGVVLNVIRHVDKQLSYITTGQEVPHHIEVGRPARLAGLIVEGKLT